MNGEQKGLRMRIYAGNLIAAEVQVHGKVLASNVHFGLGEHCIGCSSPPKTPSVTNFNVETKKCVAKFVLLDPSIIANISTGMRLVPGHVKKVGRPLFGEQEPWEQPIPHNTGFDNVYPSAWYDSIATGKKYKMAITPFLNTNGGKEACAVCSNCADPCPITQCIEYFESEDGLAWTRPDLGIVSWNGSKHNNIALWPVGGLTVIKDTAETDPSMRYKAFGSFGAPPCVGCTAIPVGGAVSPDGRAWQAIDSSQSVNAAWDTQNNAFFDRRSDQWVGFTRLDYYGQKGMPNHGRTSGRTTSRSFVSNWSRAEPVLWGSPAIQNYAMIVLPYYQGYLGLTMWYNIGHDSSGLQQTIDVELSWSNDTVHWARIAPGAPLIPRTPWRPVDPAKPRPFDSYIIFAAAYPFLHPVDDLLQLYYGAGDGPHSACPAGRCRKGFVSLARLRVDGFAGWLSTEETGQLTTSRIKVVGSKLLITADVPPGGQLKCGVLASSTLTTHASVPITGNVTDQIMMWHNGSLKSLLNLTVQLVLEISEGAVVYSFGFADSAGGRGLMLKSDDSDASTVVFESPALVPGAPHIAKAAGSTVPAVEETDDNQPAKTCSLPHQDPGCCQNRSGYCDALAQCYSRCIRFDPPCPPCNQAPCCPGFLKGATHKFFNQSSYGYFECSARPCWVNCNTAYAVRTPVPPAPPFTPPPPPRHLLFIDRTEIAELDPRLSLRMQPPAKGPRVITPDKPWESWAVFVYNALVAGNGSRPHRLYYDCVAMPGPFVGSRHICLAESRDGLVWTKPELGIFAWNGSKANNIMLADSGVSVFIDPSARSTAERWKMVCSSAAYTSADGLRWNKIRFKQTLTDDTKPTASYDPLRKQYVVYVRRDCCEGTATAANHTCVDIFSRQCEVEGAGMRAAKRHIGRCETADIGDWEQRSPNGCPSVFGPDEHDPDHIDFYTNAWTPYPSIERPVVHLFFPSAYHTFNPIIRNTCNASSQAAGVCCPCPGPGGGIPGPCGHDSLCYDQAPPYQFPNDGLVDVRLVVSRDGLNLSYTDTANARSPFVPLGDNQCGGGAHSPSVPDGWCSPFDGVLERQPFDTSTMYMASGYILSNNGAEIFLYVAATPFTHGSNTRNQTWNKNTGISVLRMRKFISVFALMSLTFRLLNIRAGLDGFVAVEAPYFFSRNISALPSLLTVPIAVPTHCTDVQLLVNMQTSVAGFVALELSENGAVIPGYGLLSSDKLKGGAINASASWGGRKVASLSTLAGRSVAVRAALADAKLYSLRVACLGLDAERTAQAR
jgi:hypothetical protein